jgi:hypothetical protein
VSKLLGTTFGLSITTDDADTFLVERINKALQYWSTKKINSIRRGIVVNGVLLSSTCFFTSMWGGTLKRVNMMKGAVANYFWSGVLNWSRTKVSWLQCCQTKG